MKYTFNLYTLTHKVEGHTGKARLGAIIEDLINQESSQKCLLVLGGPVLKLNRLEICPDLQSLGLLQSLSKLIHCFWYIKTCLNS